MSTATQTERAVLRHFLPGFSGASLPGWLRKLLREGLAGVALYPRNFSGVEQLRETVREIRGSAGGPVAIGIDQEGGTPFSLPEPFTQWPSPAEFGAFGRTEAVREAAECMAAELRSCGINLNFAPMLDLHLHRESPVTRGRSYGGDPRAVGRLAAAFIDGHWRRGKVGACAKHFPGHGDATVDPHSDLPVYHGSIERLRAADLEPFRIAAEAGVPAMMTAHIQLPSVCGTLPASLSCGLVQLELRERIGFRGAVLADDLGMGAIRRRYSPGEAGVAALQAGSDIVMLCHDESLIEPAIAEVARAAQDGAWNTEERRRSSERVAELLYAIELGVAGPQGPGEEVVGCARHAECAAALRAAIAQHADKPGL